MPGTASRSESVLGHELAILRKVRSPKIRKAGIFLRFASVNRQARNACSRRACRSGGVAGFSWVSIHQGLFILCGAALGLHFLARAVPAWLLVTVPNMLGVEYNVHLLEGIVRDVAPAIGWVPPERREAG